MNDLTKWKHDYLDMMSAAHRGVPLRRVCWHCGNMDAPYDWWFLPSSHHEPMCEPCYATAAKAMRQALAAGVVYSVEGRVA